MDFTPGIIVMLIILLCFFYGLLLFIVWTNQCLFNNSMTLFCYLIPLFILIFCVLLISTTTKCEKLYSIIYLILMLLLGYLLYIFLTSVILRIVDACVDIPKYVGIPILYGLPLIICIYGVINALISKIVRITLKFKGYKEKITILHLTDIHLGAIHQKKSIERIVNESKELNPDIVVITGDMADGSLKVKDEWLKPFDELSMPILYVTGNHEEMNPTSDMLESVSKTKINHIGDHGRFLYKGVNFIGEDFGYDLRECLENVNQENGVPNVLLSHIPILKPEELKQYNIFLFLAGHTHGGQMFPFHIPAYFSNACFSGLYSDKEKLHHVFVSDGVNNNSPPMRVGSSRVMALITITGDDEN